MKGSMRVAVAGVSGALSAVFLIISVYVQPVQLTFLIFSSLALMLPLTQKSYITALLAYASTSVVCFFITGGQIQALIGYWLFFGLHPILACLLKNTLEKLNKPLHYTVTYSIKLVYVNVCLVIAYFVLKAIGFDFALLTVPVWALFIIANPVFVVYDYLIMLGQKYIDYFMHRNIYKTIKTVTLTEEKQEDIFGLDDDKKDEKNSILDGDE